MDQPWINEAKKYIGLKEKAGKANNPEIVKFYADAGHPEVKSDEVAWCAAFAGSMLKRSGFPIPARENSLMAMSYEKYGQKLDTFKPGCICVFYRGRLREKTWQRHVGFGLSETKTHIMLLGGNQSDSVSIVKMPKSSLVAMRWPVVQNETPKPEHKKQPGKAPVARPVTQVVKSSRTIRGAILAILAAIGERLTGLIDYGQNVALDAQDKISSLSVLTDLLKDNLKTVFFAVIIAGSAYAIYRRIQDDKHREDVRDVQSDS